MKPDALGERLKDGGDRVRDAAERGADGLQPLLDHPLIRTAGLDVTAGKLIVAVVVLIAAWLVSVALRRTLRRFGDRHPQTSQASLYTISRLAHYLLLAIGFLWALDLAGIPIGKFTVFAGALGVGLGFGLQAIFSNFVSGLILLFDRSLRVGDFVQLDADLRGTVRAINIRATRIITNDNIDVIVPNSEFVTGRVVNWTHHSVNRRIRVPFQVAYGVDKEVVKKAALEAAAKVPFTLTMEGARQPQVWLVGFGESAVQFVLAVWLTEQAAHRNAAINAAYLWELDTALKAYGVEIPLPQRDLHLRSAFGLEGEQAIAALRGLPFTPDAGAGAAAMLEPHERAALSRNDARVETERGIEEDAVREASGPRREADDAR